ncbi:MAG TPA: YeaH/YhbH family protein [Alphaproteobacteria bacterium]
MNIIDRRLNPKGKSLTNRQRFLRRARRHIQDAMRDVVRGRGIADVADGEKIAIPADDLREPAFHNAREGGVRDYVLPGNKEYLRGDRIPRPEKDGGGGGSQGSPDGDGEDDFHFMLSKEEFLDIFLEDLELPDLVKKKVQQLESPAYARAGFSVTGTPASLSLVRTMRNSLSRRIALRRPSLREIEALEDEIAGLDDSTDNEKRKSELEKEHARLTTRRRVIPFIDPLDVRYHRFEPVPKPITKAVMFCLMDVSGSMNEHMKDLAKRFFMLLYVFLTRRYRHVDIVFIRHTHEAAEVDEQTFFYSTDTGGTVVSTALAEMKRIVTERYSSSEWNIYAAQASDGDNSSGDNARAAELLEKDILPLCQHFAYVEVGPEDRDWTARDTELWGTYKTLRKPGAVIAMRKVRRRNEIFPVFHDLFAREQRAAS